MTADHCALTGMLAMLTASAQLDDGTYTVEREGTDLVHVMLTDGEHTDHVATLHTDCGRYEAPYPTEHPELVDALGEAGWERTCNGCAGQGGWYEIRGWRATGTGYGDAVEIERAVICGDCDGEGVAI